jgi:hypothetical protein
MEKDVTNKLGQPTSFTNTTGKPEKTYGTYVTEN